MRLGIFGGSFDPVHYGHLLLAEACREQCRLDQVWLLPAAVPPHKQDQQLTAPADRLQMLRLAIGGHEPLIVSELEIEQGGVNYTADTLERISRERPEAALFFLMGADSLQDLPRWHDPARICQLAIPVVVRRAGSPEPQLDSIASLVAAERVERIRRSQVEMPVIGLSSTDIRQRVARGLSIRYRTPRAVEQYIYERGLYRR